ncbi:family 16 glycosylhydrolase [Devosia sp. Naph2]|uniref:family 16 glycosylhydrolase n=1 Tax=Devosia polycyclovorans TaxID=3345148 RepID=UPI0035D0BA25
MTSRSVGVLCGAVALLASPAALGQDSFFDDFDQFDRARWYVSDGWSNGTHQNCTWTRDQISVVDGSLRVAFSPIPAGERLFRCGEAQSHASLGYGTYEARIKTPSASGLNAAFFTYIGPVHGKQHDEIDFEILTKDTTTVHTTTFVNGVSGDGQQGGAMYPELPYPADEDFIDYAFVWAADRVDFYVNGELVRSITDPRQIPFTPQRVFFSLWGTDTLNEWMGPFVAPSEPIAMEVDYFAFTALGAPCQFPESVVCATDP